MDGEVCQISQTRRTTSNCLKIVYKCITIRNLESTNNTYPFGDF
jgi:hypothetical protein